MNTLIQWLHDIISRLKSGMYRDASEAMKAVFERGELRSGEVVPEIWSALGVVQGDIDALLPEGEVLEGDGERQFVELAVTELELIIAGLEGKSKGCCDAIGRKLKSKQLCLHINARKN